MSNEKGAPVVVGAPLACRSPGSGRGGLGQLAAANAEREGPGAGEPAEGHDQPGAAG